MIVDIVRTHPVVLVGGVLQENPFYLPPGEFLSELRSRESWHRAPGSDPAQARNQDVARLSGTLRDLLALGTLSALEAAREPKEVVERFAQAVLSLPFVELVFVRVDSSSPWSG